MAAAYAFSAIVIVPAAFGHTINPEGAPHDHFQCYKAKSRGFARQDLTLTDDFESGVYTVLKSTALCLPADKNGEGVPDDPATHLDRYKIKRAKSPPQPKHERQRGIGVLNQFGTIVVDTVKPSHLLVPTARGDDASVVPPDDGAHDVDHYKCYRVKISKNAADFFPRLVTIDDDFENRSYVVKKPTRICTPVDRNGQGIKNDRGHFMCYQVKRNAGEPKHTKQTDIHTANVLAAEIVDTKKENELCVPSVLSDPACVLDPTFDVIQERIFAARGCTVSTCHGALDQQGDLDLRPGAAYPELVGVLAAHPAAAAAGKLLVEPGNAAGSFLSQKLHGTQEATEGASMPLVGGPLTEEELAVVDAWIDDGAPATGIVSGAPCLPEPVYQPQTAPPVPAGGYQLELVGPTLLPGEEEEGCLWIPTPNATDFDVLKWEFVLNPGTHHFSVFQYNRAGAPTTGVWTPNDFGCFSGAQFGNSLSGTPQAPYYVDAYPDGVARRLEAGKYLGLNAHYYNTFDVPIDIRVWVNIYPYSGTADHIAETIIAIDDTFTINVPAFQTKTHPGRWQNASAEPWSIVSLSGHMHKRGTRFTEWLSDGTKIYENFAWSHPISRYFSPPLVLQPGDYIDFECEHDNGATDPAEVKRRSLGTPCPIGDTRCIAGPKHDQLCNGSNSFCDSSPGAGDGDCDACPLRFGVSAEDEMCILTGQFYRGE